jgi:hypothetical protein
LVLERVDALAGSPPHPDPGYVEGLRSAVAAAVSYGIASLDQERSQVAPIPALLYVQAREAARNGVSLDTVLRRYFAGYTLLEEFFMQEAEERGLRAEEIHRLVKAQADRFDRLLATITEEYQRENENRCRSRGQANLERVRGLLAGRPVDAAELDYELDAWHVGVIVAGAHSSSALRRMAKVLDLRALPVDAGGDRTWAWFGGRRKADPEEVVRFAAGLPQDLIVAVGEPGHGRAGWRLTHLQAGAALSIALRTPERIVRYRDVAMLASILGDEVLATSLRELYLKPLEGGRHNGKDLRETLRAYFAAERNVSSAAALLGVSRHTVANRLQVVEEHLDRPLNECATEVDIALRLEGVDGPFLLYRMADQGGPHSPHWISEERLG